LTTGVLWLFTPNMQRITILGSPGSGKSSLARRLAEPLCLPIIHLDTLYWRPGWIESDQAMFRRLVAEAALGERWIMDGNYSHCLDMRLPRTDTVIILDCPRWLCLYRVVRRAIAFSGRTRPDMADGCPEKVDWQFLKYVWRYQAEHTQARNAKIAEFGGHTRIVRLKSPRDITAFVDGVLKSAA